MRTYLLTIAFILGALPLYSQDCPCYLSLQVGAHSGSGELHFDWHNSYKTSRFTSGASVSLNSGYYFNDHFGIQASFQHHETVFSTTGWRCAIGGCGHDKYFFTKPIHTITFGPEVSTGFSRSNQFYGKVSIGLTTGSGEPYEIVSYHPTEFAFRNDTSVIGASVGYRHFFTPHAAVNIEGSWFHLNGWYANAFTSLQVGLTFRF